MGKFKVGDKVRFKRDDYDFVEIIDNIDGFGNYHFLLENGSFNDVYLTLVVDGTFEDRLLIEAQKLSTRLKKLNVFMSSEKFIELDRINKDLLYEQNVCMTQYLQILGQRLEVLNITFTHKT